MQSVDVRDRSSPGDYGKEAGSHRISKTDGRILVSFIEMAGNIKTKIKQFGISTSLKRKIEKKKKKRKNHLLSHLKQTRSINSMGSNLQWRTKVISNFN